MCGLFGVIQHPNASTLPLDALIALGDKAISRGTDSAGLAYLGRDWKSHIVKSEGLFTEQFSEEHVLKHGGNTEIILGHTRHASQGNTSDRHNMSPMRAGRLIGTHNGDITISSIPNHEQQRTPNGDTDSERLLRSINDEASLQGITKIFSHVEGRIALAWVDRSAPHILNLARGAIATLATAIDKEGNFYWATNPNWFRTIDKESDGVFQFTNITIIPEGTLLTVDTTNVSTIHTETFIPVARHNDTTRDGLTYRGFTDADKKTDKKTRCHIVRHRPTRSYTPPVAHNSTPTAGSYSQTSLWGIDNAASDDELWGRVDDYSIMSPQQEALDFIADWYDEGCPTHICEETLHAQTPSEIANFCYQWGLDNQETFTLIKDYFLDFPH